LGGSEFYEMLGYVGLSVPQVRPAEFLADYRRLEQAGEAALLASVHGLYRGGLAVHLVLASLAAGLGLEVDLSHVAPASPDYVALYSESAGRFLVSIDPAHQGRLEEIFQGQPLTLIGRVREEASFKISRHGRTLLAAPLADLRAAWERRFGSLV
jgi:phosphoribosylformylglycinamidine (FGAM) synthase-like enzyme